ncbi:MAG: sulfurtransferase TusA family protein [Candidatus Puniceispirillaceae bacterium]
MTEFDFTGLKCPLPVLKARRALKDMASDTTIRILADDPAAPLDFEHFCETAGHHLEKSTTENGVFTFEIRKGSK